MLRRCFTIGLATVVLVAAPALAKGTDGVVLNGGGQEITVSWEAPHSGTNLEALVRATHLYDVDWWNGDGGARPRGDLGPVIVAEWDFPEPVGAVIVQHLYPFAENGPVGHVLGNQQYLDQSTVDTWHPLASDIVEHLRGAGFDTEALLAVDPAGAGPITFETVGWVIALSALLAFAAIMRGRRIRQVA